MLVAAATGGVPDRVPGASTGGERGADEPLVDAARAGDRAAFGRLFERYAPMVHGIVLSRVPAHEADDLVQDVFVSALQRLDTLRAAVAFGGWLASIARNRAIDFHRGRKKTTELPEDLAHVDPEQSEAERVLVVIRELPEAYRETLVLRLVEGMSGPEIAERVGITADSVRVNLHRGMKLLREKLEVAR
jgi:RNA polymerase sigma-70 factor (ECF subfamily)